MVKGGRAVCMNHRDRRIGCKWPSARMEKEITETMISDKCSSHSALILKSLGEGQRIDTCEKFKI